MNRPRSFFPLRTLPLVLAVLLTLIVAAPVGAQDDSYRVAPEVAERINRAWEAYRNGNYQEAIERFEPLLDRRDLPPDLNLLAGRSYYHENSFGRAREQFNTALRRLSDHESQSMIERYLERSKRLDSLDLRQRRFAHFNVLTVRELPATVPSDINQDLEKARRRIGSDLDLMPDQRFTVIAYPQPVFRRVVDAPVWSGGVFDGKIHIPYRSDSDEPYDQRSLYHEYAHALVHLLARNNVPLWFNEGFATLQEYRQSHTEFTYRSAKSNSPPEHVRDFEEISALFNRTDEREKTRLAYEYSYSIVKFIEERFGIRSLKRILERTGEKSSFEKAVEEELGRSLDSLQFGWESWFRMEVR